MRVISVLLFLLFVIRGKDAASHSLQCDYTCVIAASGFPEFTAVGLVDHELFTCYDSNIKKTIPSTEWIKENEGDDYWDRKRRKQIGVQRALNTSIQQAKPNNILHNAHSFCYTYGCRWDDQTGATAELHQFGYNGEIFHLSGTEIQQCIAPVQQAFNSALKWECDPDELDCGVQTQTQICVEQLKKFESYRSSALKGAVPPEVSLQQTDPSSPVTCHVTALFPRGVMVTWQKNGRELDVDVELEETVHNGDGTFQTRSHLRVKPEDWKRDKYTCTVQHKSLEQDIILTVTEGNITIVHTSSIEHCSSSTRIIIGCVVGSLQLVSIIAIGVLIWKTRNSGYG